jgi:hypothetical protein
MMRAMTLGETSPSLRMSLTMTSKIMLKLGCSFLVPFLQSGTPPKGNPEDSVIFLPFVKESFLIFLQFEPPPKGMLFSIPKEILPFLFIPLFPVIND